MDYIFLILIGIFIVGHTLLKPRYFWEHRKALRLRNRLGDKATTILYLVLGGVLLLLGVMIGIMTALHSTEFLGMPLR